MFQRFTSARGAGTHESTPKRNRAIPVPQHAASVAIIPILRGKRGRGAAIVRASASQSTLAKRGASNDNGNAWTGTVSRNTLWIANQMARFKTTPTTAAVMADRAALSALLP